MSGNQITHIAAGMFSLPPHCLNCSRLAKNKAKVWLHKLHYYVWLIHTYHVILSRIDNGEPPIAGYSNTSFEFKNTVCFWNFAHVTHLHSHAIVDWHGVQQPHRHREPELLPHASWRLEIRKHYYIVYRSIGSIFMYVLWCVVLTGGLCRVCYCSFQLVFLCFYHPFSHHPTSSMTTVSAIIGPWTTLIRVIVHGIDLNTQKMIGGSSTKRSGW